MRIRGVHSSDARSRVGLFTAEDPAFWETVAIDGPCWRRGGKTTPDGYTYVTRRGTSYRAHRYAWLLSGAALGPTDTICHTCDVPNCVRNDDAGEYTLNGRTYERRGHLYKATQPVNVEDRDTKGRGRWASGERHGTHTRPESVPRGERSGNAKLTESAVRQILSADLSTYGAMAALARRLNVTATLIKTVRAGKIWRHVQWPANPEMREAIVARSTPWAAHPEGCRSCGSKERRHKALGLCTRCHARIRMQAVRAAGKNSP